MCRDIIAGIKFGGLLRNQQIGKFLITRQIFPLYGIYQYCTHNVKGTHKVKYSPNVIHVYVHGHHCYLVLVVGTSADRVQ